MTESKISNDDAKTFHGQARTLLFADKKIPFLDDAVSPWADPLYLAYFDEWEHSLHDFDNVGAAMQAFADFSARTATMFPDSVREETLTIERTHNFGAVSVTVGMTRTVEVRGRHNRSAWYKILDDTLELELEKWVRRNASKVNTSAGAAPAGGGGVGHSDYIEEPAVMLLHEFANNRHQFKVMTPKFMKYGVPLYPEMLPEFGYSEEDMPPMGETKLDGVRVRILMDGTKPKKVVGKVG